MPKKTASPESKSLKRAALWAGGYNTLMIGYKAKRLDRWCKTQAKIRKWLKVLEINKLNQQRRIREVDTRTEKR
jgi:hypothetical protein